MQEPFATIAAEAEKATKDVTANYLSGLDQLQGQKAAAGDIDGVVAIKQERDRVTNHEQPTAADLQAMSAPVRKLRATYEADTKKAADEAVRRDKLARSSYLANLEALQKRMNAAGEIEQGLLVKAEKDRFIAELAAHKGIVVAPKPLPPPSPAALPRSVARVEPKIAEMGKVVHRIREMFGDERTDTFVKQHIGGGRTPVGDSFGANYTKLESLGQQSSWSAADKNDAVASVEKIRGAFRGIFGATKVQATRDFINRVNAAKVLDHIESAAKAVNPTN